MKNWLKKLKVKGSFRKENSNKNKFQIPTLNCIWNLEFFYLEFFKNYSLRASQPRAFKAIFVFARVTR